MINYKDYTTEDFLADEFFVNWVLNPDEETNHFWNNWIARYPGKRTEFEMAQELVKSIRYNKRQQFSDTEYALLLDRLLAEQAQVNHSGSGTRSLHWTWKAAAIVTVLATALVFSFFPRTQPSKLATEWHVVKTEPGQKKTVNLPDGTKVKLNAGSSLTFPAEFHKDDTVRLVRFSGEGFFQVTKNKEQPFKIQTGALTTRVLGTSFNVKGFENDSEVSVAVVTGKVQIINQHGDSRYLLPNDMGVFDKTSNLLEKKGFDYDKILAWKDGILLFEDTPLPEIFDQLEKWYGVDIVIRPGLELEGRYTGEYQNKSLELVLEGISFTSNFNYDISNKTVKIYEKKN